LIRKNYSLKFLRSLNINQDKLRYRDHDAKELAFYSKATCDIEYEFPFGWGELLGIADRTDYDLKRHMEYSGESLEYLDSDSGEKYVPYCIEPSFGVDRLMLMVMCDSYVEEQLEKDKRVVMKLHPALAPYKVAVLPLSKQLNEKAKEVVNILNKYFAVLMMRPGASASAIAARMRWNFMR
jgi:glycyl-tRNA synthetase